MVTTDYAPIIRDRADIDAAQREMLRHIKSTYTTYEQSIFDVALSDIRKYYATPIDWHLYLNEIEYTAWSMIKGAGHLPLYPQYPVLNYFIDFANPIIKVGVEIDGAEYHNNIKDMDYDRDRRLGEDGWVILRIPAGLIMKSLETPPSSFNSDDEYYFLNTAEGIFEALKILFFKGTPRIEEDWYLKLCAKSVRSKSRFALSDPGKTTHSLLKIFS